MIKKSVAFIIFGLVLLTIFGYLWLKDGAGINFIPDDTNTTKAEIEAAAQPINEQTGWHVIAMSDFDLCYEGTKGDKYVTPFKSRCTHRKNYLLGFNGDLKGEMLRLESILSANNWEIGPGQTLTKGETISDITYKRTRVAINSTRDVKASDYIMILGYENSGTTLDIRSLDQNDIAENLDNTIALIELGQKTASWGGIPYILEPEVDFDIKTTLQSATNYQYITVLSLQKHYNEQKRLFGR